MYCNVNFTMNNHPLTKLLRDCARLKFYNDNRVVLIFWVLVTLIFVIDSWVSNRLNNYLIFENTFRNLTHQQSLYAAYPAYHEDANHYGPVFSLIIAPFALFPNWFGLLLWNLFNCFFLFRAIQTLPLSEEKRVIIGYIAIPCLIESMLNQQFNAGAGALMILSYTLMNRNNGIWSAMCLILGAFVKLYGGVGLVFFCFAKNKPAYIAWLIVWSIIFYCLPMLFASPEFVSHSYLDWKDSLISKNVQNIVGGSSDISIMGFFRSLLNYRAIPNYIFLTLGAILFLLPFNNIQLYGKRKFQLMILSSVLIFPILFSTGSEDCTYIISITAVGIWYVQEHNRKMKNVLLPILLFITCNFPLLLFPGFAKAHPLSLSILSFPYFIVWVRVLYLAVRKKYHYAEDQEMERLQIIN